MKHLKIDKIIGMCPVKFETFKLFCTDSHIKLYLLIIIHHKKTATTSRATFLLVQIWSLISSIMVRRELYDPIGIPNARDRNLRCRMVIYMELIREYHG